MEVTNYFYSSSQNSKEELMSQFYKIKDRFGWTHQELSVIAHLSQRTVVRFFGAKPIGVQTEIKMLNAYATQKVMQPADLLPLYANMLKIYLFNTEVEFDYESLIHLDSFNELITLIQKNENIMQLETKPCKKSEGKPTK